jgi:GNAT superfamily N-acetyltransferase
MIEVREATNTDARALAELRWEFRSSRGEPNEPSETFTRRCTTWMRHELQPGRMWKAWVAVEQKEIVGQIWVHTVPKIPNPIAELEKLAYISNLYVKLQARGGTGTRLLEAALAWCRANQIDRVVLWPTKRSVTLYVAHGFSHGGDVMELKIRN